jgi:hypothetical protein
MRCANRLYKFHKIAAFAAIALAAGAHSATALDPVAAGLIPHRAVYDMSLVSSAQASNVAAMSGRIVYKFTGSHCNGYSIDFRFVSEIVDSSGKPRLTDIRTQSLEGSDYANFQFVNEVYLGSKKIDVSKGAVERAADGAFLTLVLPKRKTVNLNRSVYFPTQHMIEVIRTAQAGETIFEALFFDGSDGGDKAFSATAIIGRALTGTIDLELEPAADVEQLTGNPQRPVTVSYFDESKKDGGMTPFYEASFILYDNGVSRHVKIDYGQFKIKGKLAEIEFYQPDSCE